MTTAASPQVSLFYSYAHEDEALRDELAGHLKILERRGLIRAWHDRQIAPGQDWHTQIDRHLDEADLVLLLLSSDFIASDYIFGVELERARQRLAEQRCEVVPILVRAVDLEPDDFWFMSRQALPQDLKPVTSWDNRDEAWTNVAKGLRRTVESIRARPPPATPPAATAARSATDMQATPPTPDTPSSPASPDAPGTVRRVDLLSAGRLPADDRADLLDQLGAPVDIPARAGAPQAAADDRLLHGVMDRVVQRVAQTQRERGGPPLLDRDRALLQQEALSLIDMADPRRVLWVDDHPEHNLGERAALAQLQIEVVPVHSTAEALARIHADAHAGEHFDLVLSDWARPADGAGAGVALLRALRAAGQHLPVVYYHGAFDAALRRQRALQAQAEGALGEAVMPDELMALVQRALLGKPAPQAR